MSAQPLVWLITGTSSGIGRELALEALERGEKVIATARAKSVHKLEDLTELGADTLELDVTSPLETLHEVAKKAVAIHGRIDVVVNNAGYAQVGTVEEVNPKETYDQINTHVLGSMNVCRAFLPYMRERKTGTILFIGSVYGYIGGAALGVYACTKWALRGIAISMHDELSPLGIRASCIDFGFFRTPALEPSQRAPPVYRVDDYKGVVDKVENLLTDVSLLQPGDPRKGARVIVDLVRGEGYAVGKEFPTGLCLGVDCYQMVKKSLDQTLARVEEWKEATCSTDYD